MLHATETDVLEFPRPLRACEVVEAWTPYEGKRGGKGWQWNGQGKPRYQEEKPRERGDEPGEFSAPKAVEPRQPVTLGPIGDKGIVPTGADEIGRYLDDPQRGKVYTPETRAEYDKIPTGALWLDIDKGDIEAKRATNLPVHRGPSDEAVETLRGLKSRLPSDYRQYIEDSGNADDPETVQEYLQDQHSITVRDDGLLEFDRLTPDVRRIIGDQPVVVLHHTSTAVLPQIAERGLRPAGGDIKVANPYKNTAAGVYVTTEGSGPVVDGYRNVAVQAHGGEPITLEIRTTLDALTPDPDDEELGLSDRQFILPGVSPSDILNLPAESPADVPSRPQSSLEISPAVEEPRSDGQGTQLTIRASQNGSPVGSIELEAKADGTAYGVGTVYVEPGSRRQGVSTQLHAAAFREMNARGLKLTSGMLTTPENQAWWKQQESLGNAVRFDWKTREPVASDEPFNVGLHRYLLVAEPSTNPDTIRTDQDKIRTSADAENSEKPGDGADIRTSADTPRGTAAIKRHVESWSPEQKQADWKANKTRGASFKSWFGDWEHEPETASKVVDAETGQPKETSEISGEGSVVTDDDGAPIVVYHGTSHGGFEAFDKAKLDPNALYGPGMYFTEDQYIAGTYKDKGMGGTLPLAQYRRLETMVEEALPDGWKLREIPPGSPENPSNDTLVDVIDATGNRQFNLSVVKPHYKEADVTGSWVFQHMPKKFGWDEAKTKDWKQAVLRAGIELGMPEVKAAYLNIRKPYDADTKLLRASELTIPDTWADFERKAAAETLAEFGERRVGAMELIKRLGEKRFPSLLKASGFDGITHIGGTIQGGGHKHRVWIAFDPEQIKAVDNRGTFDPTPNMYESQRPTCKWLAWESETWDESKVRRDRGRFASKGGVSRPRVEGDDLDADEPVEIVVDGWVSWEGPKREADALLQAQWDEAHDLQGISVHKRGTGPRVPESFPKEKPTRTPAGIPIPEYSSDSDHAPGGKQWKDPPEVLYHATFNAGDIEAGGFKPLSELDPKHRVLGGSDTSSMSLTTRENAEAYRDGMAVAMQLAQGKVPWERSNAEKLAQHFGVEGPEFDRLWDEHAARRDATDSERWYGLMQGVSFAGKKFPLFITGRWSDVLKNATEPPRLVKVSRGDAEHFSYHPSETEWKVKDPERLKVLGVESLASARKATPRRIAESFDETKVKRDKEGQFAEKDGGGSSPKSGRSAAADKGPISDKPKATETPAFKRWFGNSKIVDKSGKPLVVYHGTDAEFRAFEPRKGLRGDGGIFEFEEESPFKFFAETPQYAWNVARTKGDNGNTRGRVMAVHLRMENPLDMESPEGRAAAHRLFGLYKNYREMEGADADVEAAQDELERMRSEQPKPRIQYVQYDDDGTMIAASVREKPSYQRMEITLEDAKEEQAAIIEDLEVELQEAERRRDEIAGTLEQPINFWQALDEKEIAKILTDAGYDGVIFRENEGEKSYAVLKSEQVKLAKGNKGSYSLESPNVDESEAVPATPLVAESFDESKVKRDEDGQFAEKDGVSGDSEPSVDVPKAKPVDTPAFKKWFGKSKAVHPDGTPQVMYHGAPMHVNREGAVLGDLDEFDRNAAAKFLGLKEDLGMDRVGTWFSNLPDERGAGAYASGIDGGAIYPVYLAIENPWEVTFDEFLSKGQELADWKKWSKVEKRRGGFPLPAGRFDVKPLRAWLKSQGYDGIKFKGKVDHPDQQVWVALEPEQVKSATGNRGTFDPKSSKINESRLEISDGGRKIRQVTFTPARAAETAQLRLREVATAAARALVSQSPPPVDEAAYRQAVIGVARRISELCNVPAAVLLQRHIDPQIFQKWRPEPQDTSRLGE